LIARIEVLTTERAVRICGGLPQAGPLGYLDRQFSLPFLVALAAIAREINSGQIMGPPSIADDMYLEFARKRVAVNADPSLASHGNICPTIIRVYLTDGSSLQREVLRPWGCPDAPLTSADIQQKFQRAARERNIDTKVADALLEGACALDWSDVARRLLDCVGCCRSTAVQKN
jgi:2-methylcitrate dehydratase PrpD